MSNKKINNATGAVTDFNKKRVSRSEVLKNLYGDETDTRRRYDRSGPAAHLGKYNSAADVRNALNKVVNAGADNSYKKTLAEVSEALYATNPIYKSIIDYMVNMFKWDYKVIPHKLYTNSKAAARRHLKADDFMQIYNQQLEIVDGLALPIKGPNLLTTLFLKGAVYYTTLNDADSLTIDTLILPNAYCRKIGDTQFGTAIISFDMSYFSSVGLAADQLDEYFESFPEEFKAGYLAYLQNGANRWIELDPRYSSGILLNSAAIPTYLYIYGGILDFEKYQDNELERNENALKYLVIHTIPHYEDQLIFEVDEVAAMHKSLKKIVDTGEKARLITTYGDIHVEQISENDTSENEVLSKAFQAVFNSAGFNSGIFTSESVTALEMSLIRDKGLIWRYIQQIINFYNVAVNNWFDFKGYQADIDILPISAYTYKDDIEVYKNNATLGVNKIDYLIASGIQQKHIKDTLDLEKYLGLENITPMQTSYTQTAEDRSAEESSTNTSTKKDESSGIEPSDNESNDVDEK